MNILLIPELSESTVEIAGVSVGLADSRIADEVVREGLLKEDVRGMLDVWSAILCGVELVVAEVSVWLAA